MKYFIAIVVITIVVCTVGVALYSIANSESFQLAGVIVPRVNTDKKIVALTFDDGPNEHTDEIIKVLYEEQVPATFYLVGNEIEKHGVEAEKIVNAGHEIGNHSYSHQRMVFKSPQFIEEEVKVTNTLIRSLGYEGEITFRPPYGKKLLALPLYLQRTKQRTVTWDVEPLKALGDDVSSQQITDYVLRVTKPGSIILIHPWYGQSNASRESISEIIQGLKQQGYTFVRVSDLLNI